MFSGSSTGGGFRTKVCGILQTAIGKHFLPQGLPRACNKLPTHSVVVSGQKKNHPLGCTWGKTMSKWGLLELQHATSFLKMDPLLVGIDESCQGFENTREHPRAMVPWFCGSESPSPSQMDRGLGIVKQTYQSLDHLKMPLGLASGDVKPKSKLILCS